MPRDSHWKDLKVGILAAAVAVGMVASILLFARVGAIRGERFTLYLKAADATGVAKGTDVWLSGQKVGLVTSVDYLRTSTAPEDRLLVRMDIRSREFHLIRKDSHADIRPGGSLVGAPVVFITGGTASSAPMNPGDTLAAFERTVAQGIIASMGQIGTQVSALGTDMGNLVEKVKSPSGTTGAYLARGMPSLTAASTQFSRLTTRMASGGGTVGLASRNGLFTRASAVMASFDSLRTLLAGSEGNVGRFRRDSTLSVTVKDLLAQVDSIRAMTSNGVDNAGLARGDSTLVIEIARARRELDALVKDIKKHPLRYIAF